MEIKGLRQVDLVERTGIPKGSINQYVSGFVEPKSERIYKIAKALGVSEAWLMGFDVPMEKGEKEKQAEILASLSKDEALMKRLMAYMSLSEKDKKMLDSIVDAYIANAKTEQP